MTYIPEISFPVVRASTIVLTNNNKLYKLNGTAVRGALLDCPSKLYSSLVDLSVSMGTTHYIDNSNNRISRHDNIPNHWLEKLLEHVNS